MALAKKTANTTDNRIAADSSQIAQSGGLVFTGGGSSKVNTWIVAALLAGLAFFWWIERRK